MPHWLFSLPTISQTVRSSRLLLTRESSRGTASDGAALEDLAAPVILRGAMVQLDWGGFQQEANCWSGLDVQALRKGAAAAMCYEGEEGAFSAKL
jgi:hypothetical protein